MRKTRTKPGKKSEAESRARMQRVLKDAAVNERELQNQRTKPGRGKGKKTGRKSGVRRGGR